jgi:Ca2+-binding EF-hand superfamily protein
MAGLDVLSGPINTISRPGDMTMMRLLCALSVAVLAAQAPDASAKLKGAKGDKVEMLFKKLDTNGDGTLSKEEFVKLSELRKNSEGKGKGKGAELLFSKLDTNGDGKLTLEEFRKLPELRKKKKEQ